MVYLNEGMEGGATRFTELDLTFQPKLGHGIAVEQSQAGRLTQPGHHALRRTGDLRLQGHHHQVVSRDGQRTGF